MRHTASYHSKQELQDSHESLRAGIWELFDFLVSCTVNCKLVVNGDHVFHDMKCYINNFDPLGLFLSSGTVLENVSANAAFIVCC